MNVNRMQPPAPTRPPGETAARAPDRRRFAAPWSAAYLTSRPPAWQLFFGVRVPTMTHPEDKLKVIMANVIRLKDETREDVIDNIK